MKYLIILFFILNDFVFTQNIIRGKVTDSETNKPLSKANVVLEGVESTGTSTNEDGSFILENVFPGNKIVISYVGYNSQKHFITKDVFDSTFSIKLIAKIIPAQ